MSERKQFNWSWVAGVIVALCIGYFFLNFIASDTRRDVDNEAAVQFESPRLETSGSSVGEDSSIVSDQGESIAEDRSASPSVGIVESNPLRSGADDQEDMQSGSTVEAVETVSSDSVITETVTKPPAPLAEMIEVEVSETESSKGEDSSIVSDQGESIAEDRSASPSVGIVESNPLRSGADDQEDMQSGLTVEAVETVSSDPVITETVTKPPAPLAEMIEVEVSETESSETVVAALPDNDGDSTVIAIDTKHQSGPNPTESTLDSLRTPQLDVVRVDAGGMTVVAGKSEADSEVLFFVNGQETAVTVTDLSGNFATVFQLEESIEPRILTLVARKDSRAVESPEEIIIAPFSYPNAIDDDEFASEVAPTATQITGPENDGSARDDMAVSEEVLSNVPILRLNSTGPELMSSDVSDRESDVVLTLDTISYGDEGEVLLTGSALPHSTIILYVDEQVVRDFRVNADGRWMTELVDLDPGDYTLRLDLLRDDGTVLKRIATRFTREPVTVLAQATSVDDRTTTIENRIQDVTIKPGDTLWAISRKRYGQGILYVRVFDANRSLIRDPDLIYPGQVFVIPD